MFPENVNPDDLLQILEANERIRTIMDRYEINGSIEEGIRWAKILYDEYVEENIPIDDEVEETSLLVR